MYGLSFDAVMMLSSNLLIGDTAQLVGITHSGWSLQPMPTGNAIPFTPADRNTSPADARELSTDELTESPGAIRRFGQRSGLPGLLADRSTACAEKRNRTARVRASSVRFAVPKASDSRTAELVYAVTMLSGTAPYTRKAFPAQHR